MDTTSIATAETRLGVDLLAIAIYLKAYPRAPLDEVCMFVYNQTGSVYSREQVSKKITKLGTMRNKWAPTEAYKAFEPHNVLQFRQFWTLGGPLGVVGVSRRSLLDIAEFGIAIQKPKPNSGHAQPLNSDEKTW